MQKETRIEQIQRTNNEIIEKFYNDTLAIIKNEKSTFIKQKMLHSAKYWANYFTQLNNNIIQEHLQEKQRLQK